ncbi:uncharacterized protein LOC141535033 [Cotesia typhae]|uniref:uncharacterized protein LOC141535033 n=1 Tax=Cotesia typhae TaxID=2053667 RepID=UPI003D687271
MSDNQTMDLRKNIFLIDKTIDTISDKKLATNKEALQLLFHYTRNLKQSIGDSCPIVISEIKKIWDRAKIPTQDNSRCVAKLNKLYTNYRDVQKTANRNNKTKEQEVCNILDKLFDIAHSNIFEMIDETKQFLIDQRTQRILHLNYVATYIELSPKSEILISSPENQLKNDESLTNTASTQSLTTIDHVLRSPEKMSDIDTPSTSQTISEIKSSGETISNS